MQPTAWRCPFCGHYSTITSQNRTSSFAEFDDSNKYGTQGASWTATTCPNPKCREYAFSLTIFDFPLKAGSSTSHHVTATRHQWQLVPAADMKVLPDYVPAAIIADYKEACLIATLSPKASATLSRRALQGMIRDYWNVKPGRLVAEIKAIETLIDGGAWQAIEAVRKVGNIGAHMEADVSVIVDVDPNEAKLLIGLIETLVDDWYVTRHDRQQRFGALAALAESKQQAKKQTT